jgi:membrane glycosyltransferase
MIEVLPHQGRTWLETAIVVLFGALFGWISIGFWTALAGFLVLLSRRDRFSVSRKVAEGPIDPAARTAVIMPICEEPVDRVFAGLRALYRSVERTGFLRHFDFYVLSDTADPDIAVCEEEAWFRWCREVGGFGRIFYRRRRVRVRRKSGNVADFCRRFGRRYRYMVTLDADSVMSGETLVRLVRIMEANRNVGLVQTVPVSIRARSLYGRLQQFANRLYGPLFSAGMHFFQLGDAPYWGHNTILRVRPFMRHCALPRLPGRPPLGGEILSHDFVEAALMGRAGYSAWLAYDLGGSYEELPSSLLEDLQRDRRWCQGNLQHLRLLFVKGLFAGHRALFLNGALAYVSAILWFGFLSLSTAEAILEAVLEPQYFPEGPTLFPQWPIWRPDWAISLLAVTLAILFLPKLLSVLLVLRERDARQGFGGALRLLGSVVLEVVFSTLFAPIRMVFHTKFVLANLLGKTVTWRSQSRGEHETPWREALRHHAAGTVIASLWGLGVYWLNPDYFWWLAPIVGALLFSVPLSVVASRVRLGDLARRAGLFLVPEETTPPRELADLEEELAGERAAADALPPLEREGFVRAVVDPFVNALHRTLLRGPRRLRPSVREARWRLAQRALAEGPGSLGPRERRTLLLDPDLVDELHLRVWEIPDPERSRLWGRPGTPLPS